MKLPAHDAAGIAILLWSADPGCPERLATPFFTRRRRRPWTCRWRSTSAPPACACWCRRWRPARASSRVEDDCRQPGRGGAAGGAAVCLLRRAGGQRPGRARPDAGLRARRRECSSWRGPWICAGAPWFLMAEGMGGRTHPAALGATTGFEARPTHQGGCPSVVIARPNQVNIDPRPFEACTGRGAASATERRHSQLKPLLQFKLNKAQSPRSRCMSATRRVKPMRSKYSRISFRRLALGPSCRETVPPIPRRGAPGPPGAPELPVAPWRAAGRTGPDHLVQLAMARQACQRGAHQGARRHLRQVARPGTLKPAAGQRGRDPRCAPRWPTSCAVAGQIAPPRRAAPPGRQRPARQQRLPQRWRQTRGFQAAPAGAVGGRACSGWRS